MSHILKSIKIFNDMFTFSTPSEMKFWIIYAIKPLKLFDEEISAFNFLSNDTNFIGSNFNSLILKSYPTTSLIMRAFTLLKHSMLRKKHSLLLHHIRRTIILLLRCVKTIYLFVAILKRKIYLVVESCEEETKCWVELGLQQTEVTQPMCAVKAA